LAAIANHGAISHGALADIQHSGGLSLRRQIGKFAGVVPSMPERCQPRRDLALVDGTLKLGLRRGREQRRHV
jgi:hypothetical protein